jgi:outer membrane protein TolC
LAAIELAKISDANAELGYQRARPTLEAYGSYAFNGRNVDQSEAHSDAFNNHHKTWIAGVRFSTSFDMGGAADVRAGYIQEQRAAELNLQRKLFDEQQDWKDLNHKFDELKRKFEMAKAIEMGQKEKLEYERNRFNRGRTTTYQVLMFEQDYALAQVNRIKTQSDFMQVLAQLKLFNETKLEELLPAENNSNTTGGAI